MTDKETHEYAVVANQLAQQALAQAFAVGVLWDATTDHLIETGMMGSDDLVRIIMQSSYRYVADASN